MAATVLVCRCGKRISAPGARPGRAGRCPACGASLRIPDGPAADPVVFETDGKPLNDSRIFHVAGASAAVPPSGVPPPSPRATRKRRGDRREKQVDLIERLEGWKGLVRRPEVSEAGFWNGLLYPFWDANGLAFLLIFPIIWWLIALPTFEYASAVVGGEADALGPPVKFLIPSLIGLILVAGYTLAFLSEVFLATAAGNLHHPRWPELEFWELARIVIRWVWVLLAGLLMGGAPAWMFLIASEEPQPLDWIAFGSLLTLAALYAEVALAALLLFDDLLAVNPVTVGLAVWRTGPRFLRPLAFALTGLALVGGFLWMILHITSPLPAIGAWLLFWEAAFYGAMTTMHELGLEYHRNARRLDWFREGR